MEVGSLKAYIDIVVARKERRAEQLQQMFDFFIIDIAFFQLVLEVAPLFPEYRKWIDELSKDRLSRWEYTGSYEDSVYVVQQLFTDRTIGYGQ